MSITNVTPGTGVDEAARKRGTSVYFPDRVLPMLPEALSNGLCSLQAGRDRLCVCCEMTVSRRGEVRRSRFYEAVMRSVRRFTYEQAAEHLSGQPGVGAASAANAAESGSLAALAEVYRTLRKRRRQRGALEFEVGEVALELDARGRIENVVPRQRLITHRIIEECMIAANVEAARWLRKARIPTLYRVHGGPSPKRAEELALCLGALGFTLGSPDNLQPDDLNRVLKALAGSSEADLVETMMLRCMARGGIQTHEFGPLRPRSAGLRSLHVADPPLPGPAGSPGHQALAAPQQAPGGSPTIRRP